MSDHILSCCWVSLHVGATGFFLVASDGCEPVTTGKVLTASILSVTKVTEHLLSVGHCPR